MKNSLQLKSLTLVVSAVLLLGGCTAKQSSRVIEAPKVESYNTSYAGEKSKVVVGNFVNRSSFQNGIFSNGVDRLGSQAKTILISNLQQTNRFAVLDRDNMDKLAEETGYAGTTQSVIGGRYLITGDVTEFGRKTEGDKQLFGLLGKGKSQIAYSRVTLNIVDTQTTAVVYSVSGAGEYSLSEREVLGFGSSAGYDATLNGKVLELSIREAINNLVAGIETGQWQPES
ncbi:CsgG/HfaB family protein [Alteromonas gilva]|uniref:Curli production assembly/transport component CsgG n=1 Tax=Alteromonas gilva TaxID=2987522 RepID=A0ABT5L0X2_9ALTE|nr:CsgG/HfaB family protein [Alteromonas gilva]MDC8829522.1 CsgG/HfaB family protein [Alteromonas gilva]